MTLVYVYAVDGETYALCRGHLGGWFRSRCIPAYRTNVHNGWFIRVERVDDILARMQQDGFLVRFARSRWPLWVPPALDQSVDLDIGDEDEMRRTA